MKSGLNLIDRLLAACARVLIRGYQLTLSPLIRVVGGPASGCRHEPSCSHYAMECYRVHPFHKATWLTAKRVFKCSPLFEGGYDPVPPAEHQGVGS